VPQLLLALLLLLQQEYAHQLPRPLLHTAPQQHLLASQLVM
jgi:hypothetical protein